MVPDNLALVAIQLISELSALDILSIDGSGARQCRGDVFVALCLFLIRKREWQVVAILGRERAIGAPQQVGHHVRQPIRGTQGGILHQQLAQEGTIAHRGGRCIPSDEGGNVTCHIASHRARIDAVLDYNARYGGACHEAAQCRVAGIESYHRDITYHVADGHCGFHSSGQRPRAHRASFKDSVEAQVTDVAFQIGEQTRGVLSRCALARPLEGYAMALPVKVAREGCGQRLADHGLVGIGHDVGRQHSIHSRLSAVHQLGKSPEVGSRGNLVHAVHQFDGPCRCREAQQHH